MAEISSWILSIAGVVCLSILIELILPDGQMNKYIKGIFSFVIVFVIISPIPRLLNVDYDFSNVFNYENTFSLDENYLYQLNLDKLNLLQEEIQQDISNYGYQNVEVYINGSIFDNGMEIKSVYVDLSSLVITKNAEHKDISKIKTHLTEIIQEHIQIDEEMILYDS
ncbi:MAG: stage III sporulation protein AF [Clostridia bacterium]|nr:stage III sporulation protein AF [Clostridia bacterium]MBQ8793039.1 stage III sporulation protein AF [Clostridia bacterium]